jgi:hypothetical protein
MRNQKSGQIRVVYKTDKELRLVKIAAEKIRIPGLRVLQEQLFPVKIDSVNRLAILDKRNEIHKGIIDKLGQENKVKIEKMSWLSRKDNMKAYRSMVIYAPNAVTSKNSKRNSSSR